MPRRVMVVSNPRSRKARKKTDKAIDLLEELGLEVSPTTLKKERTKSIFRVPNLDFDAVVIAGGDGTINAVLRDLVHAQVPLGILPLGTANNVARTLEIPLDLRAACEVIKGGESKTIDVGEVNGHYFLTTASMGLSVRITRELSGEAKRRWGRLAYVMAALKTARSVSPFLAELKTPARSVKTCSVQIVVGNGLYYGTKLRVADDAEIDDHALDVVSVEVCRWWQLLKVFPSLKKGDLAGRSDVLTFRTTDLTIVTQAPRKIDVDGELIGSTPARFRVLPGALRVLAPRPTD